MNEYEKIANGLLNNPNIKKFLNDYNKSKDLPLDLDILRSPIMLRDVQVLMIQLGIPMGATQPVDKDRKDVFEWSDSNAVCWEYRPINSIEDLIKYQENNYYTDLLVNPSFLPYEKVQHIAYCLEFANDKRFFDFEMMNKLQAEIISVAPLKYNMAMQIFNKYYTKEIQEKFINEFGVPKDRFFELSGLNNLIDKKMNKDKER